MGNAFSCSVFVCLTLQISEYFLNLQCANFNQHQNEPFYQESYV